MSFFGRITSLFGTDFAIIANLIRIFGPDSRIDRPEGNLNRGFSMKIYPDPYFPNIIPALKDPILPPLKEIFPSSSYFEKSESICLCDKDRFLPLLSL